MQHQIKTNTNNQKISKMKNSKKILGLTIADFTSDDSSKVISIGLDKGLRIVARESACTKEGCNCVGGWINGNKNEVERWVEISDFN